MYEGMCKPCAEASEHEAAGDDCPLREIHAREPPLACHGPRLRVSSWFAFSKVFDDRVRNEVNGRELARPGIDKRVPAKESFECTGIVDGLRPSDDTTADNTDFWVYYRFIHYLTR